MQHAEFKSIHVFEQKNIIHLLIYSSLVKYFIVILNTLDSSLLVQSHDNLLLKGDFRAAL